MMSNVSCLQDDGRRSSRDAHYDDRFSIYINVTCKQMGVQTRSLVSTSDVAGRSFSFIPVA